MTTQRNTTDRGTDGSAGQGGLRGRIGRWAAGAAVGATLMVAGAVTATPAHAVSLPGRCALNAGVWTCLPASSGTGR